MSVIEDQTLDALLYQQLKQQVFAFTPASPRSQPQSGQEKVPQSRFTRIVFGSGHGQHGIAPPTNRPRLAGCLIPQIANPHRLARTRLCHNDMPAASTPSVRVRCTRRERVERAIWCSLAASTTVAPANTASTARRLRRKRSRTGASRVESSKVGERFTGLAPASRASSGKTVTLSLNSEGRGRGENGGSVRGKANQRSEPAERDGGEIDQQMSLCCAIRYHLLDGSFPLGRRPAFSQTFDHLLHAGGFSGRPDDVKCLFQLLPGGKRLTPSM